MEMDISDYLSTGDVEMLKYAISDLPEIEKVLKKELEEATKEKGEVK